jgi:hypothetical protein
MALGGRSPHRQTRSASGIGSRVASPDDDLSNWTVWIHRAQLTSWMREYVVKEWLPDDTEPSWDA